MSEARRAGGIKEGQPLLAFALLLALLYNLVPIFSFDLFTHLAVGDWILRELAIPRVGLFSATRGDAPWVDNEWGFQLLLALAHRALGPAGVVLLSTALTTAALAITGLTLLRRGLPPAATAVAVAVGALALGTLNGRPQPISYLFFSLTLLGVSDLADPNEAMLELRRSASRTKVFRDGAPLIPLG